MIFFCSFGSVYFFCFFFIRLPYLMLQPVIFAIILIKLQTKAERTNKQAHTHKHTQTRNKMKKLSSMPEKYAMFSIYTTTITTHTFTLYIIHVWCKLIHEISKSSNFSSFLFTYHSPLFLFLSQILFHSFSNGFTSSVSWKQNKNSFVWWNNILRILNWQTIFVLFRFDFAWRNTNKLKHKEIVLNII